MGLSISISNVINGWVYKEAPPGDFDMVSQLGEQLISELEEDLVIESAP